MSIALQKDRTVTEKGHGHRAYEGQGKDCVYDGDTALGFDDWSARDSREDRGTHGAGRRVDEHQDPLEQLIAEEEGPDPEESAAMEPLAETDLDGRFHLTEGQLASYDLWDDWDDAG